MNDSHCEGGEWVSAFKDLEGLGGQRKNSWDVQGITEVLQFYSQAFGARRCHEGTFMELKAIYACLHWSKTSNADKFALMRLKEV